VSRFDLAIGPLLKNEGSAYVPEDHGRGASRWGVTLKSYRELCPSAQTADIHELGREQAIAFYQRMFWDRYNLALIEEQAVANKVLDLAVNCGPGTAIRILQRAIGAPVDGVLGPKTAAAANQRTPELVLQGIRTAGAQYYQELVDRRPEWKNCLPGWLARLKG
jgi:lysozyme family protein